MAKVIVHISGEYPDRFQPSKTKAVSSLVEAVHGTFDQRIYSINRTTPKVAALLGGVLQNPLGPKFNMHLDQEAGGATPIRYGGLPGGLYLTSTLSYLADEIAEDLARHGIHPDIVHGHKLTLEGLVAEKLSAWFECPYALSVQVNTDNKILKYRPDLTGIYRRIYQNAAIVFPFSVMGQRLCDSMLGTRKKPTVVLPCTSPEDRIIAPRTSGPELASVCHLKDYRNKNVAALIKASAALQNRHEGYQFHLYGAGSEEDEKDIDDLIARSKALSFLRKGAIKHKDVQTMLNKMCGFAMVSKRETFGMVFLEALLAGCPVVFPKDWAIDGFFDDASFAIGVSAHDQKAIEAAMEKLIVDQSSLKSELANWQKSGKLAHFQRKNVVASYKNAVIAALANSQ